MTKTEKVFVRVPPELKAAIVQDAKNNGLDVSARVRQILTLHYDSQAQSTSAAHEEPSPDPAGVPAQEA